MFRKLQTNTQGILYLHSMPGRYEALEQVWKAMEANQITAIICLASEKETEKKSPDYAIAITECQIPAERIYFPVPDFGTPEDIKGFYTLAREVADRLKFGENLLVHCAGGIGRTGMLAGCVLAALDLPLDALKKSGSGSENGEQEKIIRNFS